MLRLEGVTKRYDDGTVAVDNLDLTVEEGEVCVLVGPSGSGKTTTLRMINRLIEPTSGRIYLGDHDVTSINAVELRRKIGYVIQHVGLFPHLTVEANVGTVPRLLGWDKQRTRERTRELLELVGLDPERHSKRYPAELSGGQRQRAGVARALAADPPVLLMDEPFGAIDPITRARLQAEFIRLQQELRKTVVIVTHDIEEAVHLADRIALLAEGGHLAQHDTPARMLAAPASSFVAQFVGADRGLKRLSVTPIDKRDLDQVPTVSSGTTADEAGRLLAGSATGWIVVVDDDEMALGWVGAGDLDGSGPVDASMREVTHSVGADATLRDAFVEILKSDDGWVAVMDGGRCVGALGPDSLHLALRHSIERDRQA